MVDGLTERRRRLFLAVHLADDTRHALVAHIAANRAGPALPGRPVPPENWHLTLRFLGWVDDVRADVLSAALDQANLGRRFTARFGGLGAFPKSAKATVMWLGLAGGTERLAELSARVEEVCVSAGFSAEERPFHPHVTLSRIRPQQDVRPLIAELPAFPARLDVDAVTLYESHMGGGGVRYEEVERFPLT